MMVSPIQTAIMRKAIDSPLFSKEILPKAPLSIFEDNEEYKQISNIIKRYYQTNSNVLTEEALLTLAEDKLYKMKKKPEEIQHYFNVIHDIYAIRDSADDEVIDEKIEEYIKKHMRVELLKQAAMKVNDSEFMDSLDEKFREIMLLQINGGDHEIINVIDDTEYKRLILSTIHSNTISTGFPSIDNLNGGGLAKGELGLIVAASGSGKCVKGNTLIVTEKGIVEIQDIPNHFDVNPVTNETKTRVASFTEQGEYKQTETSHWFNLGKSKTIRVTTKSGYSIEGTPEHPLLTMNKQGSLVYKKLQDMQIGDYIALAKGTDMWSNTDKVSEEEAYMMALLIADGYLAQNTGLICFSNSEEVLINYYKSKAEELWGVTSIQSKHQRRDKGIDHQFWNKKVKQELELKGVKMAKEAKKEIPFTVLQSSKPVVRRFIQGMFDTEAILNRNNLELTTASKRMAEQLQVVLLNFGIRASMREEHAKGDEQCYYRLSISGNALRVFHKEIGFRFNNKYKQLLNEVVKKKTNTDVEVFPYQGTRFKRIKDNHFKDREVWNGHAQTLDGKGLSNLFSGVYNPSKETTDYVLSYTTYDDEDTVFLRNITENMLFEPIETIEDSEAVVYDFTVPETHSFVANGIISHNTLFLTNLATNYTKLKRNVLFIALEELENRMVLKFEQSMLRQNRSAILSGSSLNEKNFNIFQNFYKNNRGIFGNLLFARYSPRTVTPAKVEQLISDVKIRMGIDVDVVIIDYPELLRNPQATGNEADDGGRLFEEMRRIAQDYNVVMWTAAQMNRTAYSAQIRTAEHMEGSHRKKNAAELVLTVNQTPEEYDAGFIRLYADKVRNPPEGPYDKMLGFRVVGSQQTIREYKGDVERRAHKAAVEAADSRLEQFFKAKKHEKKDKIQAPDYAAEINASVQMLRDAAEEDE